MSLWLQNVEPIVLSGRVRIPYRYDLGKVASKFYIELRDRGKIMGLRCSSCNRTYVPPRATCGRCFSKLTEWVEVGLAGTLQTYTVVYEKGVTHPVPTPFAYGIVRLDGADTGLLHLLGEVELDRIAPNMRVRAVLKDKREGNIFDIKYFKPLCSGP